MLLIITPRRYSKQQQKKTVQNNYNTQNTCLLIYITDVTKQRFSYPMNMIQIPSASPLHHHLHLLQLCHNLLPQLAQARAYVTMISLISCTSYEVSHHTIDTDAVRR